MVLQNPNNGEPDLNDGEPVDTNETYRFSEDIDSTCSTPYVSAPSSPGRGPTGYFYSAPASPMHFVLSSKAVAACDSGFVVSSSESGSFEFEFSSRFSSDGKGPSGSMSSADELFLNGQIRPMKLSSHLQRPQILAPLMDLEGEEEDEESKDGEEFEKRERSVVRGRDLRLRNRSMHRKARSMSPLRNAAFEWHEEPVRGEQEEVNERALDSEELECEKTDTPSTETTPSGSASSSRSSSSGRNSKKWVFLKDLLYRSKSEGRGNSKEKFWSSISFSPSKEKKLSSTSLPFSSSTDEKPQTAPSAAAEAQKEKEKGKQRQKGSKQASTKKSGSGKPTNGVAAKRRVPPSPHELHYTANRAQAEEMKKRTFLPYRQGLLGCLGFSSKGYGALNGLTRTLNPVSSRRLENLGTKAGALTFCFISPCRRESVMARHHQSGHGAERLYG
uniref:Uncharacterized protein n=4 Tax=Vitis vinifera TaxID=29760 RepID=A5BJX8_VITVI|nr:hypothetical protein VITISV_020417 [Vitis vinifera]